MDSWVGENWGFDNTPIPNGKVVAYPFLANGGASGASGIVQFTNNMGDLTVSGYRWKGWFSESPGGAESPPTRILSICNGVKQQTLGRLTAISDRLRECSIST